MPWAQGVVSSNLAAPTNVNNSFICNAGFWPASAPVATCGVWGLLEALDSYNFDYNGLG